MRGARRGLKFYKLKNEARCVRLKELKQLNTTKNCAKLWV